MPASRSKSVNVLSWMEESCPGDVLPHILAFSGPHIFQALSLTSKFWNGVMQEESTWRVFCEDLYKVRKQYNEEKFGNDFEFDAGRKFFVNVIFYVTNGWLMSFTLNTDDLFIFGSLILFQLLASLMGPCVVDGSILWIRRSRKIDSWDHKK